MHIIDLNGEEYPVQATSTNEYELNGNQSLSVTIKPNKVNLQFMHELSEMWTIVDHDDVPHKIIYLKKQGQGDLLTVEIRAIPLFFDDLKRRRIYERIDQHMTAAACFGLIFENTGYTYALVDSFEAVQWEGFGEGATKLESFKRALERYRAEFRIEGKTIFIEKLVGRDTGFMYRYRLNASNIVQEIDGSELYTYAKGYGDYGDGEGGEDWQNAKLILEYTSPLADIIGIREAEPVKNGNITDPAVLGERLKERVDESLKISVTATIHDLRDQGYDQAQPQKGDRVFLIDERIGFNEEVRVVDLSLTRDWQGNVLDLQLTFGTPGIVKRHQSRIDERYRRIDDIFEGREQLPINVLPEAIKRASEALLGAMTELEISELGIIARDINDPNNLVLYNSAGLGVSRDGGQTFENAITYLGVNTNLLTAGDIHTNNIRIIGDDNYFYWDGTGLYAIDPNDINKYVRLRSDGLHIAKGALTIERPDGAIFMQDGLASFDYNVQPAEPPATEDGIETWGRWWRTTSTTEMTVQAYSFRHEGRFLCLAVNRRMGEGSTGSGGFYVRGFGGSDINGAFSFDNQAEVDGYETVRIDIGIPTYQRKFFYLRLKSARAGELAMIRKISIWQED